MTSVYCINVHFATSRDLRINERRGGVIANNRVFYKSSPESPEVPMAHAMVRVHRFADGVPVWSGQSDADGYYWPSRLELGRKYIAVATDVDGNYECVAAGPAVAMAGDA